MVQYEICPGCNIKRNVCVAITCIICEEREKESKYYRKHHVKRHEPKRKLPMFTQLRLAI